MSDSIDPSGPGTEPKLDPAASAGGGRKKTSKKTAKTTTKKRSSKRSTKKKTAPAAGAELPANVVPAKKAFSKKAGSKRSASKGRPSSKRTGSENDDQPAEPTKHEEPAMVEEPKTTGQRKRSVPDLKARARARGGEQREADLAPAAIIETGSKIEADAEAQAPPSPASTKPAGKTDKNWEEIFAGKSFNDLGLRGTVLRSIKQAGFETPTKIQAELIPLAMTGKDIMGQSRTGSGKTAAFGLPVISRCTRGIEFQAVVLAPTRELAIQITDELASLARFTPLKFATVYGGQKIETQAKKLAGRPEIIVATPGRLMDMMNRGYLHFGNIRFAVLDEVDRMLDIGFRDDIKKILGSIRSQDHQTIFVSATISDEIESLARTFMKKDAERLVTTGGSLTVSLVDQRYVSVNPWDKPRLLSHMIKSEKPELALVFCRMKRTVDKITTGLKKDGVNAEAIHGDLPQGKRNSIMTQLRSGKLHVLVASDLAARGIDVDGITHVFNFDLPEDPEIYVHRIGRTARAGRGGVAFSFVSPDQGPLLTQVEVLANTHIPSFIPEGFKPGPVPTRVIEERQEADKRTEQLKARNRYSASKPQVPAAAKVDPEKFPGGVVPTKLPKRRMGGKLKTSRVIAREQASGNKPSED